MKLTVTIEVSATDMQLLRQNSLERVLNTGIEVADQSKHEDAWIFGEDIHLLKSLASRLWYAASSQALVQGE